MKKLLIFLCSLAVYFGIKAQNILLDKPVLAGTLTLFPDMNNPNQYYFLPNKLRLGVGEGGKPQFSFLRFVQNLRSETGEEAKREGDGGGVVHAVVELYVSDEQRKDAEKDLKKLSKNAEAVIIGPVIYKSGTMSLVSSIANEKGGYAKSVIGLGPAPLLVGNKAAVSVLLTKDGSKILWESFKTSTPDMSFSFVMNVGGYRSPIAAKIEVDFEKVYSSEVINLGLKFKSKSGASSNNNQGTQAGGTTPVAPTGTTATPSGTTPAAPTGTTTTPRGTTPAAPTGTTTTPSGTTPAAPTGTTTAPSGTTSAAPTGTTTTPSSTTPAAPTGTNTSGSTTPAEKAVPAAVPGSPTPVVKGTKGNNGSLDAFFDFDPKWIDIIEHFDEYIASEQAIVSGGTDFFLDADLKLAFEEMRQTGAIKVTGATGDANMEKILEIAYNKLLDMMFERVDNAGANPQEMNSILQAANQRNLENNGTNSNANNNGRNTQEGDGGKTSLGITFAYQLKKIKKSGKFVVDLNRSLSDELQFRFDENFGKLNCKDCFKQVNLDDPFFRQREIQVSVDGLNADQFKKYVNFATVSMKKIHGNNDITSDEVRIGIDDFDKKGNVFRLLYGWKDEKDADKSRWLKYEYKTIWSLFGDYTIESDWKTSEAFGVNVAPPVRPVSIDVEASPDLLKAAEVRNVNVKFYYNYGGGEKVEQINIRATSAVTAAKVELLLPQNQYDYEYEITWQLTGNREVKSGKKKSNSTMLYVDELPK